MKTLQQRTAILKVFTKHLISIGKEAYLIPDGMIGKPEKFIPYLYFDHELRLFFDSADSLPIHSMSPNCELVIPVLFRMLYCCGLRPQEVRHLRWYDVNLIDGTLHIVDSKRNKDRIVVMAEELRCLCQRYNKLMQCRLTNREFFFQHPASGEYSAVGTSKTTFSPAQTCSRAQIITFLWRAMGSPEPRTAATVSDVKSDDYYYKAVLWAAENNMFSGDVFLPNAPCTRAMAVEFIWEQAGRPSASGCKFIDVPSSASYAQAVAWAISNGVTYGTSNTTFSPDANCTREQIVTFLYRTFAE